MIPMQTRPFDYDRILGVFHAEFLHINSVYSSSEPESLITTHNMRFIMFGENDRFVSGAVALVLLLPIIITVNNICCKWRVVRRFQKIELVHSNERQRKEQIVLLGQVILFIIGSFAFFLLLVNQLLRKGFESLRRPKMHPEYVPYEDIILSIKNSCTSDEGVQILWGISNPHTLTWKKLYTES